MENSWENCNYECRFSCSKTPNIDNMGIISENWLGSRRLKSSKMMVRSKGLWSDEESSNEKEEYVYTNTAVDP